MAKEDDKSPTTLPLQRKPGRCIGSVLTKMVPLVVGCLGVVSSWLGAFRKILGFWMC